DLPRLRCRLPRDAGGDRHGVPRVLPVRRRPRVPLHPVPERAAGLDHDAGTGGRDAPGALARPSPAGRGRTGGYRAARARTRRRALGAAFKNFRTRPLTGLSRVTPSTDRHMKIESAQITMQARHVAYRREQLTLAVERWSSSSDRPASAPPRGEVLLGVDDGSIDDPRLLLLRAMIERMLGITLRVIQAEELSAPETATYSAAPPPPVPRGSGGQSLSVRAERVEYEHVGFSASGVV